MIELLQPEPSTETFQADAMSCRAPGDGTWQDSAMMWLMLRVQKASEDTLSLENRPKSKTRSHSSLCRCLICSQAVLVKAGRIKYSQESLFDASSGKADHYGHSMLTPYQHGQLM